MLSATSRTSKSASSISRRSPRPSLVGTAHSAALTTAASTVDNDSGSPAAALPFIDEFHCLSDGTAGGTDTYLMQLALIEKQLGSFLVVFAMIGSDDARDHYVSGTAPVYAAARPFLYNRRPVADFTRILLPVERASRQPAARRRRPRPASPKWLDSQNAAGYQYIGVVSKSSFGRLEVANQGRDRWRHRQRRRARHRYPAALGRRESLTKDTWRSRV